MSLLMKLLDDCAVGLDQSPEYARTFQKLRVFWEFTRSLAGLSTCKRLQVGCCLIDDDFSEVLAIGYNGSPRGSPNDACRKEAGACGDVHSESNTLVKLKTDRTGLVMLVTTSPCEQCAGLIANSKKVSHVVYGDDYRESEAGFRVLKSAGIVMVPWRFVVG